MASVYETQKLKDKLAEAEQKTRTAGLAGVSAGTADQLTQARQTTVQSPQTQAAQKAYETAQAAKPAAYASAYDQQLNSLYNKIVNQPAFTYDAQSDPMYQQYKTQYLRQGKQAMQDTQGRAAALTGGYGNTYAATAGAQAYQEQLAHLNDAMPQLYEQARSRYDAQSAALLNQYQLTQAQENQDYSRWADAYDRWQAETSQARSAYEDQRDFDYQAGQDNLAYWQAAAQAESNDYRKGQAQAYSLAVEMIKKGQTPDDSLLWQAGLSANDLSALQAMYAPKKKSTQKKAQVIQLTQSEPAYRL